MRSPVLKQGFGYLGGGLKSSANLRHESFDSWQSFLRTLFPAYCQHPFGSFHEEFWDWIWALKRGERPRPFISVWARGAAKSTSAEMACVVLGAERKRTYILYVCGTQAQADDHVQNVADMLSSPVIARRDPDLAARRVSRHGAISGWRRNRLRTKSGLTVDAIGLDVGGRGKKLEEHRPDFIIFDDVDDGEDSDSVVDRKIRVITRKLLPSGSEDLGVLGVQNLVHPGGVFAQLVNGEAKFLNDRIISGPHPAILDLDYNERPDGYIEITNGTATWEGLSVQRCETIINDEGLIAFLVERQHRIGILSGVIFNREWWQRPNTTYDPDSGNIKNRVRERWIFADTALKDKEDSSYTAFVVLEVLDDYSILVREVWREHLTFPGLIDAIKTFGAKHNADGLLKGVVIEDKVSGTSAIQTLVLQAEPWLADLLVPFLPSGSKDERARQAASWCEFPSLVLMPQPKPSVPWLFDFLESELFRERPETLDRRDAFSMGVIYLELYAAAKRQAVLNSAA